MSVKIIELSVFWLPTSGFRLFKVSKLVKLNLHYNIFINFEAIIRNRSQNTEIGNWKLEIRKK